MVLYVTVQVWSEPMIGDAAKAHQVYGGVPDLAACQRPSGAQAVISAISGSQWSDRTAYLG
jgi:hypothetical protein